LEADRFRKVGGGGHGARVDEEKMKKRGKVGTEGHRVGKCK